MIGKTTYVYHATRILYKWLNRKGQRKACNRAQYNQALAWVGWPSVRIRKDLNPITMPNEVIRVKVTSCYSQSPGKQWIVLTDQSVVKNAWVGY